MPGLYAAHMALSINLSVLLVGVLIIVALLFGVCVNATDCWNLLYL